MPHRSDHRNALKEELLRQ